MNYFKYIIFFVGIGLATLLTKLYANNPTLDSAYFFDKTQDFEKAERFFKLYLSENKKMDSLYIEVLLRTARAERILFKKTESLNTYLKAIEWSKKINNAELLFKTQVQLADFYTLTQRVELADEVFSSITPQPEFSPLTICTYFHRKASFLNQMMRLDSAIIYSEKALKVAEEYYFLDEKATVYNELANLYEKKKEFEKSLLFFDMALDLLKNDKLNYSNAYLNKAILFLSQGKYNLAIKHLKTNFKNIENTNWSNLKCPILEYTSKAYFALNDSLNGYIYLSKYHQEVNVYYLNNQNKTLAELETKFKTEKKNAEIIKQKSIIAQEKQRQKTFFITIVLLSVLLASLFIFYLTVRTKNKRLSKLLKENEFFIGEANHRIKNNLQLIVSLVAREKNKKENENHEALTNIVTKIESIATLHQQLYINEKKSEINLNDYLTKLCDNLMPLLNAKNIQLTKNMDTVFFSIEKSVYMGLLLNELIINTIKHAFNKNGSDSKQISIQLLNSNNKKIEFTYCDNGKGLSKNETPKLIHLLCKQLKTDYDIKNENGFYFKTTIKLK
jgi:two-component sensor histidine kinase